MFSPIKKYFFLLLIFASCKTSSVIKSETTVYPLNQPGYTQVDSSILQLYAPYKVKVDSLMNRVLIKSDMSMEKGIPEGLLGNISADATLLQVREIYGGNSNTSVDFCFLNNGGLRASLPKGDITVGNVYSLMPFENEAVLLTLSGETTEKLIDFIVQKGGMPVAGLKMQIKDSLSTNVIINGKPFDKSKTYGVVTSDYLAGGGDNLYFLNEKLKMESTGLKIRDLIIKEFEDRNKKGETLNAKIEGRITYVK
ncbi:MAG: 5'-nucleotidase C-terminal domain-containing protein [Bacteroidetes bacterium]|nr:5'-nucleotidase C-terminal domain-containing protein [Bacteroidota bacterium]